MSPLSPLRGLFTAILTPLRADGAIDVAMLAQHTRWLFEQGCDGITLFGTTGEGPSFSVAERKSALDELLRAGIPREKITVGTGCAAITDTIELTRHAAELGCAGALVLPPFFFKDTGDDGVVASIAAIIQGLGDRRIPIFLYNIPSVSAVNITIAAIERLLRDVPGRIAGVKDSTADWTYTEPLLRRFADSLSIFVGAENHLAAALKLGGVGTICGCANIAPNVMRRLHDGEAALQPDVEAMLKTILSHSFVPVMKAVRARQTGDQRWLKVRAPLVELDPALADRLYATLAPRINPAPASRGNARAAGG
jgi:4-hydroxy-tetrahydrodipicolinate synthase